MALSRSSRTISVPSRPIVAGQAGTTGAQHVIDAETCLYVGSYAKLHRTLTRRVDRTPRGLM